LNTYKDRINKIRHNSFTVDTGATPKASKSHSQIVSKMNLIKIHLARFFLLSLACGQVIAQKQCEKYPDFFLNLNKFNPQFEHPAYTTPPIRVDLVEKLNLITFMVNDKDNFNNTKFTFKTNDPNFFVDNVIGEQNLFRFNFRG